MSENLFAVLERHFPTDGSRPFLERPDGTTVCYREVAEGSARMANALVALGVRPGDRVAAQVPKCAESLLLYLGCLRAGAIYLPLNTAYTGAELAYFLSDAQPSLMVCTTARRAAIEDIIAHSGVAAVATLDGDGTGSLVDRAAALAPAFATLPCKGDDLAAILYTSGTTGRSKGAMLSHRNLSSNAEALVAAWRFTDADVLLHALPIFHTHGLFVATNVTLLAGGAMIFVPEFDAGTVLGLLPRATAMMGVPTFYSRLLAHPDLTADRVRHIRLFISGSAPLSPETHRAFKARTGHTILERYGMTETSMITSNPYDGERRPGTVGVPLVGVEVRITDRTTGRPLGPAAVGMVEVRGPNVFKGYWQRPDKTASDFRRDGFFVTGDLGRFDDDGYLQLVGRDKDLIITGGYNVYPAEVEQALDAVAGVAESAVIGVPHPDLGEGVTAVVQKRPDAQLEAAKVCQALKERLAGYKVPKHVLFVDALPRNAMGKVEKAALRARFARLYTEASGE